MKGLRIIGGKLELQQASYLVSSAETFNQRAASPFLFLLLLLLLLPFHLYSWDLALTWVYLFRGFGVLFILFLWFLGLFVALR
jgi:hypothetical protein